MVLFPTFYPQFVFYHVYKKFVTFTKPHAYKNKQSINQRLHCIHAVVALRVNRVICDFQVSLLSRITPYSLASLKSLSFEPFIDKKLKSGFRL